HRGECPSDSRAGNIRRAAQAARSARRSSAGVHHYPYISCITLRQASSWRANTHADLISPLLLIRLSTFREVPKLPGRSWLPRPTKPPLDPNSKLRVDILEQMFYIDAID